MPSQQSLEEDSSEEESSKVCSKVFNRTLIASNPLRLQKKLPTTRFDPFTGPAG